MTTIDLHEYVREWRDLENSDRLDDDELERLGELRELGAAVTNLANPKEVTLSDLEQAAEESPTCIREEDFEDHAIEVAEELVDCDIAQWPMTCVDWERAANDLRSDYTSFDWDGQTYLRLDH